MLVIAFACAAAAAAASAAAGRHEVVVYYANETTSDAARSVNYARLLSVLRQGHGPVETDALASIVDDERLFPNSVNAQIAALLAAAKRNRFDLAVFTNAATLHHQFQFYRASQDRTETRALPALAAEAGVLAYSPLSRADYLRASLHAVSQLFPGQALDLDLITDSHGSKSLALMPRVSTEIPAGRGQEILDRLHSQTAGSPAAWVSVRGVSKAEYWRVLARASAEDGLSFPLVFRESCESGVETLRELLTVPGSVARVAHSGRDLLGYADVDWRKLPARAAGQREAAGDLASLLAASGVHVDSGRTLWIWPLRATFQDDWPYLLFLPLIGWLIWYFFPALARVWRRTRGGASP